MKVLVYATNEEAILNFINKVAERENGCDILTCRSFENLLELAQNEYSLTAVVLYVASKEDLLELLTIEEMFKDTKIILVLPEHSDTMIRQALKLYPRYITDAKRGVEEIMGVLKRICSNTSNVLVNG